MNINILLCDDNSDFLICFSSYIKQVGTSMPPNVKISVNSIFNSGKDLLEYIKDNTVDVIFLDIDMNDMSGFEVADIISNKYPKIKIIFVSGYEKYVYNSFEYFPFAYILKKDLSVELPKILNRIVKVSIKERSKIEILTTKGRETINCEEITFVESKGNYYDVNMLDKSKYVCRGSLTGFEKQVSAYGFFRTHAAFLVNLDYVDRILKSNEIIIKGFDLTIPVSRRKSKDFQNAYADFTRESYFYDK